MSANEPAAEGHGRPHRTEHGRSRAAASGRRPGRLRPSARTTGPDTASRTRTPPSSPSATHSSGSGPSPTGRGFPGFRDVTAEQWESAQWQRAHTIKNLKELKAALGEHLTDDLAADIQRDMFERATMSMLIPPQMINTMNERELRVGPGPPLHGAGVQRARPRLADPPVLAARQPPRGRHVGGRGTDAPVPDQGAGRDAPDVPAVLRPLHPHGPGRQLDAARSPSTSSRPSARTATGRCSTTCAATPSVRDVVVSGGDIANLPIKHLEEFVLALLDIENIRDIRLATKGLMGLPAALPAGRRDGRAWSASARRPASAACRSRCTPTSTTRTR